MFPGREGNAQAHESPPTEAAQPDHRDMPDLGWDSRVNQQGRADQDRGCDNGIGQSIGDGVKGHSKRFDSLRVDTVLKGDDHITPLDSIPQHPEIAWKNLQEIHRGGAQFLEEFKQVGRHVLAGNELLGIGAAEFDEVECRVQRAADRLHLGEGLDAKVKAPLHPKTVRPEKLEQVIQNKGEIDLGERLVQVLVAELLDIAKHPVEVFHIPILGEIDQGEHHLPVILFTQTGDQVSQIGSETR